MSDLWFQYAKLGNLKELQNLSKQYSQKKDQESDCMTALMHAAKEGRENCVEFLASMESGQCSEKKYTALMFAAGSNHPNCMPYLRNELFQKNANGKTALHFACRYNYADCVKYLIAEDGIVDQNGKTALQIAREFKSIECVTILEEYQSTKTFRINNASDFFIAVRCEYSNIIAQYCLEYMKQKTQLGETSLMLASKFGHPLLISVFYCELMMQDNDGNCALHYACQYNCIECAKQLLEEIQIQNYEGKTPYQISIQNKNTLIANLIQQYQKTFNIACKNADDWFIAARSGIIYALIQNAQIYSKQRTQFGKTALMLSSMYNHVKCVEFLTQFEIGLSDSTGKTALMSAAERNNYDCIQFLQQEIKMKDQSGRCALHYACINNCFDSAMKLLQCETFICDNDGKTPLQIAQERKSTQCADLILKYLQTSEIANTETEWFLFARTGNIKALTKNISQFKQKQNKDGFTALMIASQEGFQDCVQFLKAFEIGMKDKDGNTSLIWASFYNHFECIPYLKDEIGIQNANGSTALLNACSQGNPECVKLLLDEALIQNNKGLSAESKAQEQNHLDCAIIIDEYFNNSFCIQDQNQWFLAVKNGKLKAIQQVVQQYRNQQNSDGQTALIIAVIADQKECVNFLAEYEVEKCDNEGKTALMHACINSRQHMIQFLTKEIGKQDETGRTALSFACYYGFADCVKLLMDEVAIADISFKVPLQVAKERNNADCMQLIEGFLKQREISQIMQNYQLQQQILQQNNNFQTQLNELKAKFEEENQKRLYLEQKLSEEVDSRELWMLKVYSQFQDKQQSMEKYFTNLFQQLGGWQ